MSSSTKVLLKASSIHKLPKAARHELYRKLADKGQYFVVELQAVGTAKCRGCKKRIEKDDIQLRHVVCNSQCYGSNGRDVCGRWHIVCLLNEQTAKPERFTQSNEDSKPITDSSQLAGYEDLSVETRNRVSKVLTIRETEESDIKKRKIS